MQSLVGRGAIGSVMLLAVLTCADSALGDDAFYPPGWPGFAYNSQHWGAPLVASQPLKRVKWSAPVDLAPGGGAHYGSPLMSRANTVVFPVRTSANDTFRIEGHRAADGAVIWTLDTGFTPPPAGWVVSCGVTVSRDGAVAIPDSGGRVLV